MNTKAEKLSLAFTPEHAAAVREAVQSGDYASNSEVVREAMRLWLERNARKRIAAERIGALWDEGIASGWAGELTADDIKRKARAIKLGKSPRA